MHIWFTQFNIKPHEKRRFKIRVLHNRLHQQSPILTEQKHWNSTTRSHLLESTRNVSRHTSEGSTR